MRLTKLSAIFLPIILACGLLYAIAYQPNHNTVTQISIGLRIEPIIINATVDMKPETLNLRSKGRWVTSYIELLEGYDVNDIDVSTIMLNSTIPAESEPTSIGDYDNDTFQDLMVRFNRTELVKYIVSQGISLGNVTLTITGTLYNGKPIEGQGVLTVSRLTGDVNCDGVVDIYDIVQACEIYGSKEEEQNWNPNANFAPPLNKIDILDLVTIAYHYGQKYP